jgi:hypothetical protein
MVLRNPPGKGINWKTSLKYFNFETYCKMFKSRICVPTYK